MMLRVQWYEGEKQTARDHSDALKSLLDAGAEHLKHPLSVRFAHANIEQNLIITYERLIDLCVIVQNVAI